AILAAAGRPIDEPIALLVIFGLALPGLALLVCRGLPKEPAPAPARSDVPLIAGLIVFITVFLAVKGKILGFVVSGSADPRWSDTINTVLKLTAFVVVPLAVYAAVARLSPRALGLTWPPRGSAGRSALIFAVVGAALVAVQLVLGRGARPLFDGSL